MGTLNESNFRVIRSLVAGELRHLRDGAFDRAECARWTHESPTGEGGLEIDSVELIAVATAVSSFFCLHETGVEDRLLVDRTLGGWVAIADAVEAETTNYSFLTSGTTGHPRAVDHNRLGLASDASWLAERTPDVRRVVSLVPAHHLYGFMHTVLVPRALGVPVEDWEHRMRSSVVRMLRAGDQVVATPTMWAELSRCGVSFPRGVTGVSSGAPMPQELWENLLALGLSGLIDVFGSTETSALGVRTDPCDRYTPIDADRTRAHSGDLLEFADDGTFDALGRTDSVVQVGGVNVATDVVEAALASCPGVADCAVKIRDGDASARLAAFIVPDGAVETDDGFRAALRAYAAGALPAVARPTSYTFGAAIPRSAMGKVMTWTEAPA